MPRTAKPGIDWPAIRERFEQGDTAHSIAKDHDVSKQAIAKRAKKEKWGIIERAIIDPDRWLPATTMFAVLEGNYQYTPEKVAEALEAIAWGANYSVAAGLIGVTSKTFKLWRDSCPELEQAIGQAQSSAAMDSLKSMKLASMMDWKAAEKLLSFNPRTKDDMGQTQSTGGVTIVLNVPRADMIDVTPEIEQ